jgi:hypothetical protein
VKFVGLLLLVGFVCVYWKWVLAAVIFWAVVKAAPIAYRELQEERALRKQRAAEIVARADRQHAQIMNGDERGVYGAFPPATMGEWAA